VGTDLQTVLTTIDLCSIFGRKGGLFLNVRSAALSERTDPSTPAANVLPGFKPEVKAEVRPNPLIFPME
jgi:succinyl-CoA synthetase beta subunit